MFLLKTFAPGLLLACLAAALAGCVGMKRLSDEPPPGVSLAGSWQLDPQLSTDSRKALAQILPPKRKRPRPTEEDEAQAGGPYDTGEQGPSGGPQGPQGGGRGQGGGAFGVGGQASDANYTPDITFQQSLLAGGDYLRVQQRPDEFIISDGETTHSFVPGEQSVVSVPSGVADQSTGWKGKEYWIQIRPQVGPKATEKLHLSDKGDQLIETIDVGSEGRVKSLHVTRVYRPTRAIPLVVPGEN